MQQKDGDGCCQYIVSEYNNDLVKTQLMKYALTTGFFQLYSTLKLKVLKYTLFTTNILCWNFTNFMIIKNTEKL